MRDTKNSLEAIDADRYRGAIVGARGDKIWMGERPTTRALSVEKCYAHRNIIKEITCRNIQQRTRK